MSDKSPVLGILGSLGLLLLALVLLVIGIRGLITVSDGGEISLGSFSVGKNGLWLMVIGGVASAIAGIALIVVTAKG